MPVTFSREALKTLRATPANTRTLILSKVEQYARDPGSLANNVKALQGKPGYFRLRVGDRRIIFRRDGTLIVVTKVASRSRAYD